MGIFRKTVTTVIVTTVMFEYSLSPKSFKPKSHVSPQKSCTDYHIFSSKRKETQQLIETCKFIPEKMQKIPWCFQNKSVTLQKLSFALAQKAKEPRKMTTHTYK